MFMNHAYAVCLVLISIYDMIGVLMSVNLLFSRW